MISAQANAILMTFQATTEIPALATSFSITPAKPVMVCSNRTYASAPAQVLKPARSG